MAATSEDTTSVIDVIRKKLEAYSHLGIYFYAKTSKIGSGKWRYEFTLEDENSCGFRNKQTIDTNCDNSYRGEEQYYHEVINFIEAKMSESILTLVRMCVKNEISNVSSKYLADGTIHLSAIVEGKCCVTEAYPRGEWSRFDKFLEAVENSSFISQNTDQKFDIYESMGLFRVIHADENINGFHYNISIRGNSRTFHAKGTNSKQAAIKCRAQIVQYIELYSGSTVKKLANMILDKTVQFIRSEHVKDEYVELTTEITTDQRLSKRYLNSNYERFDDFLEMIQIELGRMSVNALKLKFYYQFDIFQSGDIRYEIVDGFVRCYYSYRISIGSTDYGIIINNDGITRTEALEKCFEFVVKNFEAGDKGAPESLTKLIAMALDGTITNIESSIASNGTNLVRCIFIRINDKPHTFTFKNDWSQFDCLEESVRMILSGGKKEETITKSDEDEIELPLETVERPTYPNIFFKEITHQPLQNSIAEITDFDLDRMEPIQIGNIWTLRQKEGKDGRISARMRISSKIFNENSPIAVGFEFQKIYDPSKTYVFILKSFDDTHPLTMLYHHIMKK